MLNFHSWNLFEQTEKEDIALIEINTIEWITWLRINKIYFHIAQIKSMYWNQPFEQLHDLHLVIVKANEETVDKSAFIHLTM